MAADVSESGTKYGRQYYDYNCGTLICRHPGRCICRTSGLLPVGGCIPPRSVRGLRTGETGRRVYVFFVCSRRSAPRILRRTSHPHLLFRRSAPGTPSRCGSLHARDSDPAYHPAAGLYDPLLRAAVHHPEYGERSPCLGVRSLCRPLPRRREMGDTGPSYRRTLRGTAPVVGSLFRRPSRTGVRTYASLPHATQAYRDRETEIAPVPGTALPDRTRTRIPFGAIFRLSLQENDRTFPRRV